MWFFFKKITLSHDCPLLFIVTLACLATHECEKQNEKRKEDMSVIFPDVEEIPERSCVVSSDGSEGICRPTELCVFRFDTTSQSELSSCKLNKHEIGICCPKKPPPVRGTGPFYSIVDDTVPDISLNELDSAGKEGLSIVEKIDQLELELKRLGLFVRKNTKEYFHQSYFVGKNRNLFKFGRDGLIGVEATLKIVRTLQLDSIQRREVLRHYSFSNTVIKDICPEVTPCPPTKYRMSDGSCNNLRKPSYGKAMIAFSRIIPPRYKDGINSPRIAYDTGPLPNAREVSTKISPSKNKPSRTLTSLFTLWGEFLGHDLSQTALTTASNGGGILCCDERIQNNSKLLHPACMPIFIPNNDPFSQTFKTNCMEFVRSLPAPRPDCNLGPREQLNQVTAFIDGSMIYGSSDNETNALRSFSGGKMKSEMIEKQELLPSDFTGEEICMPKKSNPCFVAGDSRVNKHPSLTVLHTLFLREHNRIATNLGRLNPGWNDEILFRETKRIIAAILQHITYTEYLRLLLGPEMVSSFKLTPIATGYDFDYSSDINPGIINSFSTAAFRMGHTLVQSEVEIIKDDIVQELPLKSLYYDPSLIRNENTTVDALIKGLLYQPAQTFDKYISSHLSQHLFQPTGKHHGLDLIAFNIQRGRDHGLAGYNEWREHCGLPRISSLSDLSNVMNKESAGNFSKLYTNVDDIDLYPAGISERPLPNAVLGPTFSCIIAEQFRRLKQGDRFWYENGGMESSFRENQLKEIRKSNLARIFCDNTKIDKIQRVTFIQPLDWNPLVSCENVESLDFSAWRNEPVWS